jgi:hypothetical protein
VPPEFEHNCLIQPTGQPKCLALAGRASSARQIANHQNIFVASAATCCGPVRLPFAEINQREPQHKNPAAWKANYKSNDCSENQEDCPFHPHHQPHHHACQRRLAPPALRIVAGGAAGHRGGDHGLTPPRPTARTGERRGSATEVIREEMTPRALRGAFCVAAPGALAQSSGRAWRFQPDTHARKRGFVKKFDAVLLKCEDKKLLGSGVKSVPVALEVLDGTSRNA